MVLDSISVQYFYYLTVAWVKISLFLVHLCTLIKKENIFLVLGIGPTQGLDDTTLTAEAQYSINFSRSNRKFCLSRQYNGSNNPLFVNATKIYQFKVKDSEIKKHHLCLGRISGDFSANNMMKKTGLNGCVYDSSVDYRAFETSSIINIHKYLMKKHDIK